MASIEPVLVATFKSLGIARRESPLPFTITIPLPADEVVRLEMQLEPEQEDVWTGIMVR